VGHRRFDPAPGIDLIKQAKINRFDSDSTDSSKPAKIWNYASMK
jgi:hypothetical protein